MLQYDPYLLVWTGLLVRALQSVTKDTKKSLVDEMVMAAVGNLIRPDLANSQSALRTEGLHHVWRNVRDPPHDADISYHPDSKMREQRERVEIVHHAEATTIIVYVTPQRRFNPT